MIEKEARTIAFRGEGMTKEQRRRGLSLFLRREPLTLAALMVLAVVLFLVVTGLSRAYYAKQESLAQQWSQRGVDDLNAQRYSQAVAEFRTALLYSRDNYAYQLNLAEALMGLNRTDEAYAYLINLWDRQPENGMANLELARIEAQRGATPQALRYYHDAIYAIWPGDQEVGRRNARLELINYLLRINAKTQAQAELIALAANLGEDAPEQVLVGQLFLRAQDFSHALDAFRLSLRLDRHSEAALAGAGEAAFELGQYPAAEGYLQAAVAASSNDVKSTARLRKTEFVLDMDPFRTQVSAVERDRIVANAFATAGDRLKSCAAPDGSAVGAAAASQQNLAQQWAKLKPQVTDRGLRRNPDMVDTAMQLVFNIERQASATCGPGTEVDQALLLIAKLHEEN
jgi:tetratricopeptide (TPR) repeat protein